MAVPERRSVSVTARDGRVLEVVLAGPADGLPLIFFHGTPGAAGPFDQLVDAGAQRGIRHVAYSRPGYGGSDRDRGRSVADCVADVVAIADALGYERFYCSGGSGGGPHSIACAALIPERVIAVAAIATPAPVDAEGLDWQAGMGKENIEEYSVARMGGRELQEYLEREAEAVSGTSADVLLRVWRGLFCEADRLALSGAYAEHALRPDRPRGMVGEASTWRHRAVAPGRRPSLDHAQRLRRDPRCAPGGRGGIGVGEFRDRNARALCPSDASRSAGGAGRGVRREARMDDGVR